MCCSLEKGSVSQGSHSTVNYDNTNEFSASSYNNGTAADYYNQASRENLP